MKVSIIGAGNVGSILGGALLRRSGDVQVKYGVKTPSSDKYHKLLKQQPKASVESVDQAAAWADVIILAIPAPIPDASLRELAGALGDGASGKVVIDVTNPVSQYPHLEIEWGREASMGERIAASLPLSHVFKAFNTIGAEYMAAADGRSMPGFTGQRLTMLIAGPKDKRQVAERIVELVGFEPCYVGPIRYARNLEAIAELWIHLGTEGVGSAITWGRNFHFQVVGRHS
jgi:predicted dinucleotide-binding enzyme